MNNYERIKAMSIEEMAKFLPIIGDYCEVCLFKNSSLCTETTSDMDCTRTIKHWLESEVEDD